MNDRKAFSFYRSHWEQIKKLNDKQKLLIFNAICEVQFLEKHIDDISFKDTLADLVWTGIKHSIDTSTRGFISKNKALDKGIEIPLAKGGIGTPCQEEEGKEEEKEKEELPEWLDKKAWSEWVQHRKEIKKTLTKSTINKQLAFLEKDILIHIAIINQSIQNGWAGLFDLKQKQTSSPSPQRGKMVGGFYV